MVLRGLWQTRKPYLSWALMVALLLLTSCADRRAGISLTDPAQEAPTPTPTFAPTTGTPRPSTTVDETPQEGPSAADGDRGAEIEFTDDGREIVRIALPLIPAIELPSIGELAETGRLAEQRLGGLVTTAISGVDVVAASCAANGGELVYGDAGDDVFESDGSGQIVERSSDGLTTLVVEIDGSGEFYDEDRASGNLLTVKVNADQSGEYFNRSGSVLTTILVRPDRSGEFFRESESFKTTVLIRPDGSGEYFDQQPTGLLTIKALADGSGEYFFEGADDAITVLARPDGSWELTDQNLSRRIEIRVNEDGSGTYARRAFDPLVFDFDTDGNGAVGSRLVNLVVPPVPRFTVVSEFPGLGKFGALNPPCATIIRFDAQLLFDFGESEIRPGAEQTLDEVVATLNEIGKPIEVNGHTDARGTDERNVELSLARANAVLDALNKRGLAVEVEVNGFGESQPVAPNETPEGEDDPSGRALNRRVEVVIRE